uniref:Uncharacterized protein n=1 Tax=Arundo donax TaxID=35708 RepID=A0A0A9A7S3_ARUDO
MKHVQDAECAQFSLLKSSRINQQSIINLSSAKYKAWINNKLCSPSS